jgi:hypothetical protein
MTLAPYTPTVLAWHQLYLLAYDEDQCYRLALVLIARHMTDLRSQQRRGEAVQWFEGGECRAWCESAGISLARVFERVEEELDRGTVNYNRQKKAPVG